MILKINHYILDLLLLFLFFSHLGESAYDPLLLFFEGDNAINQHYRI